MVLFKNFSSCQPCAYFAFELDLHRSLLLGRVFCVKVCEALIIHIFIRSYIS